MIRFSTLCTDTSLYQVPRTFLESTVTEISLYLKNDVSGTSRERTLVHITIISFVLVRSEDIVKG